MGDESIRALRDVLPPMARARRFGGRSLFSLGLAGAALVAAATLSAASEPSMQSKNSSITVWPPIHAPSAVHVSLPKGSLGPIGTQHPH